MKDRVRDYPYRVKDGGVLKRRVIFLLSTTRGWIWEYHIVSTGLEKRLYVKTNRGYWKVLLGFNAFYSLDDAYEKGRRAVQRVIDVGPDHGGKMWSKIYNKFAITLHLMDREGKWFYLFRSEFLDAIGNGYELSDEFFDG